MPAGAPDKPLTFEEEQLLLEYMSCDNLTLAARTLGWPLIKAQTLADRKCWEAEVLRLKTTALGRAEVTAQRIIDELANIAFLNPQELLTKDGELKDIHDLPENVARAIQGIEITTRDTASMYVTTTKPKLGDKIRALELLGKTQQIRLFTEVIETHDVSKPGATQVDLDERIALMGKSRDPSLIEPD